MKNSVQKIAEEKIKFFDALVETEEYEELKKLHNSSLNFVKNEKMSFSLKGKQNIYNYAREMLKDAEKEILICLPASEIIEKIRIFNFLFKGIKKGIKFSLYLNGTEEEIKKIKEKYIIEAKKTDVSLKFFMIDKKKILFSLNNGNSNEDERALWIDSDFFVSAIVKLFEINKE